MLLLTSFPASSELVSAAVSVNALTASRLQDSSLSFSTFKTQDLRTFYSAIKLN